MTEKELEIYRFYLKAFKHPENILRTKTQKINFDFLNSNYDAFFFDAFGTLFNRKGYVYPGALEWIQKLKAEKKEIRIITNAATKNAKHMAEDFLQMGFPVSENEIFTSGRFLKQLKEKYKIKDAFYLGRASGTEVLQDNQIEITENPQSKTVIICSTEQSKEKLLQAENILKESGAKLFVLNPDAYAPETDGSKTEVSGSQAFDLYKRTHCLLELAGKPFSESFEDAKKSVKKNAKTVMIGDTLGTDVLGGTFAQLDTCLILGRNVKESEFEKDVLGLGIAPTWIL